MSDTKDQNLVVNGIVAVRDGQPYVQLLSGDKIFSQLSIAQARKVAADIVQMAARTESDAMLFKFFDARELPKEAAAAVINDLRDYRYELDTEQVIAAFEGDPTQRGRTH